ncbi:cation:proton antiporter [Microlunatus elymi]|uniref:Cation:proton antiporter n=1 Tax=Microlunatus elymi TaxID=2596828 RepID=A0A516PV24_9ACTN|nr:cation:proton antiporter [Microlunatus elymi]QDP95037.1 cation:proton antiporter [Microlunatus elymi]
MSLDSIVMIMVIFFVAVLAPFVVDRLSPWVAVPSVVVEILLGIVVGPTLLGWVTDTGVVSALSDLGLAFLMFLAGYEIQFNKLRGDPLRRSVISWLISLVVGLAAGLLLGGLSSGVVIGLALTTTALGTILPILRDSGAAGTRFGDRVMAVGTVGEFAPILAIAFALSGERPRHTIAVLAVFAALALVGGWLASRPRHPRLGRLVTATLGTSAQLAVRLCVLVVVAMFALSEWLGLDPVLGGFTAGILVSLFLKSGDPAEEAVVSSRLEGIGFGFLIPIFFVVSGVALDIRSLLAEPIALVSVPAFLVLFLIVRGIPTYLLHVGVLEQRDRLALGLFAAAGLPLIVVITSVGVKAGQLDAAHAAALVLAGVLSVLIFPIVGGRVRHLEAVVARGADEQNEI